jgi:hypothetical protein
MQRSFWTLLVVSFVVAPGLIAQERAQFMLSMADDKGQPVASFLPSDLEVFEDGKAAKVVKVEPRQSAMKVVLAIDNGRALNNVLVHVRAEAKSFLNTLPTNIEVALVTSAPVPRFVMKSTMDRAALLKAVDSISPDSAPARSIEAVQDVASSWKKAKGDLVLVLFGSTYSPEVVQRADFEEARNQLLAQRAVVHAVMLAPSDATEGEAQRILLQGITSATRGRFELIGAYQKLGVLTEIGKSLALTSVGGQFVITIERPAGATGKLGALSLSPGEGFQAGKIVRMQ